MQNNEILDYFIELLNPTGNICILVMRNHLQNNCGLYGHRCTLLIHPHVINVISEWELAVVGIAAVGADGEIQ